MNREEAKDLYSSVMRNGSYQERTPLLNSINIWELGLSGQIAKNLNDKMDGKFLLGVEIGIMIALDLVYRFRKDKNAEVT